MQLDDDQQVIVNELIKRYESETFNFAQILPAATGSGKGLMATYVLKHFHPALKPLIICPKNVVTYWENLLKMFKITPVAIITYTKLAGRRKTGCKHPYLTRKGNEFTTTAAWRKLKGVFIIVDECHHIKNKTAATHWAVFALLQNNTRDKVLHMTASVMDKKANWAPLYRNLGIINHKLLIKRIDNKNKYKNYGLGDVLKAAPKHHADRALEKYDVKNTTIPDILMYLLNKYFRAKLVIAVTDPIYKHPETNQVFEKKLVNYFATLDNNGKATLADALSKLNKAKIINNQNQVDVEAARGNFGVVQLALMDICRAKLNTVVRLSKAKLSANNTKVIIACPFLEDQEILRKKLSMYKPVVLNGKVLKLEDRDAMISKFNEPNDTCRVFIMSNEMGEGISLHDVHGNFKRIMYIIPTYDFLKVFQNAGRSYRRGMMSDTEIYIVYSNDGVVENVLVNALAKTEIANCILMPGSGRVYPGAYEYEIEKCKGEKDLIEKLESEKEKVKKV